MDTLIVSNLTTGEKKNVLKVKIYTYPQLKSFVYRSGLV